MLVDRSLYEYEFDFMRCIASLSIYMIFHNNTNFRGGSHFVTQNHLCIGRLGSQMNIYLTLRTIENILFMLTTEHRLPLSQYIPIGTDI